MPYPKGTRLFLQAGLPLIAFTVVGFWGLAQFAQTRYDYQDAKRVMMEQRTPVDQVKPRGLSLEEEYKFLKEHIDLNSYENKPVPR